MVDNFFQRPADHKQRAKKKQVIESDSPDSSGGQGKYMLASTGLRWRQHCQLFTLAFLLNPFLEKELIKTSVCVPSMPNRKLLKHVNPLRSSVDRDVANEPQRFFVFFNVLRSVHHGCISAETTTSRYTRLPHQILHVQLTL
jgi:hypothetical protein